MVTVKREAAQELNGLIEDMVEYWCSEQAAQGDLVSGETAWKLVSAYAMTKEAQLSLIHISEAHET